MRILIVSFLLATSSLELSGQTSDQIPVNFAVWAAYHGEHPFRPDDPWRLRAEVTVKRNEGITDAQESREDMRSNITFHTIPLHSRTNGRTTVYGKRWVSKQNLVTEAKSSSSASAWKRNGWLESQLRILTK